MQNNLTYIFFVKKAYLYLYLWKKDDNYMKIGFFGIKYDAVI
ncbi:hypothetical protein DYBT9275_05553 [Dyadobacter sp. CECT 9275]|uniref:Uncharacterized protein n=1 Tax=Dyadobacter helix TaxID=2822344 RepID=A0A916N8H7_9BACT|nr:hypothetical protein DYBT9275_05553 [Dyadobacter sp. CECT 9275]